MPVVLKTLQGEDIPNHLRTPSCEAVFQVVASDGETFTYSSDMEAAMKVVELTENEKHLKEN